MPKFCAFCGTEINEKADFCLNCGKQVVKNIVKTESKNGKLPIWAIVLIIVSTVISLVLFLGLFYLEFEETTHGIFYDENVMEI